MLIGFKVKNFRSFNDLQHFSMIAGKVRSNENHIIEVGKNKVLKFSGIFGANGSGKYNLILAISMGKTLIYNQYYRGFNDGKDNDSYFEYELSLNDKLYSYGFKLNIYKREIVSEWLIDMTKSKEKIIKILKALDINITDFITEPYDIKSIQTKLSDNDYNNILNDLDILLGDILKKD